MFHPILSNNINGLGVKMNNIDIKTAQKIIEKSIEKGRELKLNPLMIVILDNRGAVKACLAEDGTSPLRFGIAYGKANGAFQMSMGSRALFNRAEQQAYFVNTFFRGIAMDNYPCKMENLRVCIIKILYIKPIKGQ